MDEWMEAGASEGKRVAMLSKATSSHTQVKDSGHGQQVVARLLLPGVATQGTKLEAAFN